MPVNISIKSVPDHIADGLRRRARKNHRSLQGELMKILEEVVASDRYISPEDLYEYVKSLGVETSSGSAEIIRRDRDVR